MTMFRALVLAFAALSAAATFDAAVAQKYQGIMVEESRPAQKRAVKKSGQKRGVEKQAPAQQDIERKAAQPPGDQPQTAEKPPPKKRPRGSSTYIPPPVPSPYASPPLAAPPPTQVYTPPKIDTFGDRVTRCNHSFPLNAGIGNNPTDRDSYVRQCAN